MVIDEMQVIAIYGGRFQPMGLHHKMTYEWMVNTFGYENSFIVSAGTKTNFKNPLLFEEKKMVAMAHGIPEEKFIYEKVPYAWATWKNIPAILSRRSYQSGEPLSLSNVLLFYVIGSKDMETDPRFQPGKTTKGHKTYFQHYTPNTQLSVGTKHGYLAVAPHMEFRLPNGEESSGTKLREFLVSASPQEFSEAMGFYDPDIDALLKNRISNVLTEGIKRKEKGTKEYSSYLEEIMNELQHIKKEYGSRRKEGYRYRKEASKIQDAYSEIKRLKKINDRKFSDDHMLSERLVRLATGHDDYEDKDKEFNRDSVRDFFDKFK